MLSANKYIVTVIFREAVNDEILSLLESKVLNNLNLTKATLDKRASEYKFETNFNSEEFNELNEALYEFSIENPSVNCFLQLDNINRRYKDLFVFDMDSTLINEEVIDIMAELTGCKERVKVITERAMNGELNFESSLIQRVALLKGQSAAVFDHVKDRITFTKGVKELCLVLKSLRIKMVVISGGFLPLAEHVKNELGLDHFFANELEINPSTSKLTGKVINDIITPERKEELVKELIAKYGLKYERVVVVGDGANDIPMLKLAGLGIAFNAKPRVQREVKIRLNLPRISDILFLLGLNQIDIKELIN